MLSGTGKSVSAVMSLTDSTEKQTLDLHKPNDYGTGDGSTAAVVEGMEESTENGSDLKEESDATPAWMAKYCPWMLKYPWVKKYFMTKKSAKGELPRIAKGKKRDSLRLIEPEVLSTIPPTTPCCF